MDCLKAGQETYRRAVFTGDMRVISTRESIKNAEKWVGTASALVAEMIAQPGWGRGLRNRAESRTTPGFLT